MNFECTKEKLLLIVNKSEKISGNNTSLPVLKCLLFIIDNKTLTIRSTNLDLGLEITIPIKSNKNGVIAVPADIIQNFLTNIQNNDLLKIESKDNILSIKSNNNSADINLYPSTDFPTIPNVDKKNTIKIKSQDLVNGLKSVWYSAAISSIKPELSSVYLYHLNDNFVFVSTDSFRLAEKKIKSNNNSEFDPILIPFKNAAQIIQIFEDIDEELDVFWNQNQLAIIYDGVYLTSRIVDGIFPDYKQIIPKEFSTEAIVLKQDVVNILRLSNIFSDKFNKVNIKITPSKNKFYLGTKSDNTGEIINELEGALSGENIDINFNFKYINDCIQSISSDSLSFQFKGPQSPLVIKGVSDNSFTYLVMPMNN